MEKLTEKELVDLVGAVFPRHEHDRELVILVDIPKDEKNDHPDWKQRRQLAFEWAKTLLAVQKKLKLEKISLVAYPDVGSNNADLPDTLYIVSDELPDLAEDLPKIAKSISYQTLLAKTQLVMAPTEYSTTAPLKMAGRNYPFRAATMAGFSDKMIPALRLDYNEISRRVALITDKLTRAISAQVQFVVDQNRDCSISFDLRFRKGHNSSGRFPTLGTAGNLPSGEAYIVPYEGENEPTKTAGTIPVQFGQEIVFYQIEANRAVRVEGEGEARKREAERIIKEPAYANIAELGFGVLGDFGILPIGEVLLDEKLGFHIAFGRSDHFGGIVGPAQFSSPQAVVHIDRIYIPETQPRVLVKSVSLEYEDQSVEKIILDGKYTIFVSV